MLPRRSVGKNGTWIKADARISHQALERMRRRLLRWFETHGRKFPWRDSSVTEYQQIIAEVLLQRTRAETVARIFPEFIEEFPSWKHLQSTSLSRLQFHLKPIGLWRRRSSSLQALACTMVEKDGWFPKERKEIEALPGVGQYIASSVMLFFHGVPEPLLDINMARVLERIFGPRKLADIRYDSYLQNLSRKVVRCNRSIQVNWAILDLAATTCLIKNPLCGECPLSTFCLTAQNMGIDV